MVAAENTYGFIGLGQMGYPMAKNIRRKIPQNATLIIYDVNVTVCQRFAKEFGNPATIVQAASPMQIAELSDVILTSLPRAPHVKEVYLNPNTGLLAANKKSHDAKLFLEMSTIDTAASKEVGQTVAASGLGEFFDAPCSGGDIGAEAGTLSFMVGCPVSSYPKALKVLKMMGKETSIFHCGELGAGLTTKFLNNYLSSITALATSETINIAIRAGIDPKKLNDILNVSSGQNFNSSVNCPVPGLTPGNAASRGYTGGFSIELCLGVTQLGLMTAHDVGAKVVLGEAMLQAFTDASQDDRFKGKDSRVIYQWVAHPKEEIA